MSLQAAEADLATPAFASAPDVKARGVSPRESSRRAKATASLNSRGRRRRVVDALRELSSTPQHPRVVPGSGSQSGRPRSEATGWARSRLTVEEPSSKRTVHPRRTRTATMISNGTSSPDRTAWAMARPRARGARARARPRGANAKSPDRGLTPVTCSSYEVHLTARTRCWAKILAVLREVPNLISPTSFFFIYFSGERTSRSIF